MEFVNHTKCAERVSLGYRDEVKGAGDPGVGGATNVRVLKSSKHRRSSSTRDVGGAMMNEKVKEGEKKTAVLDISFFVSNCVTLNGESIVLEFSSKL